MYREAWTLKGQNRFIKMKQKMKQKWKLNQTSPKILIKLEVRVAFQRKSKKSSLISRKGRSGLQKGRPKKIKKDSKSPLGLKTSNKLERQ